MIAPLLVSSMYSLLYGTASPEALAKKAAALGYGALALTDRNAVYGLPAFIEACKQEGIRPILGTELVYRETRQENKNEASQEARKECKQEVKKEIMQEGRAILLAKDKKGFSIISNLLTARALNKEEPFDTEAILAALTRTAEFDLATITERKLTPTGWYELKSTAEHEFEGLIIITDDAMLLDGLCKATVQHENPEQALAQRQPPLDAPPPDVYGLLSPFNRPRWGPLLKSGIPCVATAEVRFLEPEDRQIQRVLRAIDKKTTVEHIQDSELGSARAVFPSLNEFYALYEEVPEAIRQNERIVEIASYSSLFDGFLFPRYETDELGGSSGFLRSEVLKGAVRRYGSPSPGLLSSEFPSCGSPKSKSPDSKSLDAAVLERIDYELGIIDQKGFGDYFLTVRDIARRASRTCGRGSAAASIVSYCLGITDVDPIRHNLYFERFLNPERRDPPDIDIDFAWDERDSVLESVFESFGEDHVARVSNHVCFQERAAIRETARAYGIPDDEISAIERRLRIESSEKLTQKDALWAEILDISSRIVGLPRNLGVHSGGVIIVPDRLSDHVPLEKSGGGIKVTTWDKEGVEAAGLVKIDLLGNRSLAVVRDTLSNLRENGIVIDELAWQPTDDAETIAMLARGDTMGVFYVESPAMRLLQQKTGCGDFEHLVIHSSIIRPAANRYINEYIERLHGKPWKPVHPILAGLFDESYGILCYQEDVSKAAIALAGFSVGEADRIRKILTKKEARRKLEAYRPSFEEGARRKGVDSATIDTVWDMMCSFTGYSFVKAHSASYAMLSFKSAYLRCHHPAEFMAAVLSNRGGFYSTLAYVSECRRMGLTVLAPDVNASELRCRGKGKTVRLGLELIHLLASKTAKAIVSERKRRGPYRSIEDLSHRVPMDRTDAEALVGAGALDSLSPELTRAKKLMYLFTQIEKCIQVVQNTGSFYPTWPSSKAHESQELFGEEVFDISVSQDSRDQKDPAQSCRSSQDSFHESTRELRREPLHEYSRELRRESPKKILESQMKYLGTTLDVHPLVLWPKACALPRLKAIDIARHIGHTVTLLGWPITAKPVLTSLEEPMEFVSFEDETALYETVLFPASFQRYHHLLYEERPLLIKGRVECDHGAVVLNVFEIAKIG
ncbi:MAG: Error-prone DNA polymerase [Spirochaetes bacterium ADurb.Bin110]|nr:MAG: Error-prone DNA polymerase [Spirochaetes bacterium ADurb.Bin110]